MAECTIVRSPASQTSMRRVSAGNPAGAPSVAVSGPLPVVQVRMGPGGPQPQGPGPGQGGLPVVQVRMGADGPKAQGGYQVRPATIRPAPVAMASRVPDLQQYAGLTDDHLLLLRHLASKNLESLQASGSVEEPELLVSVLPAIDALLSDRAALAASQAVQIGPIAPAVINVGAASTAPSSPRRFPGRVPPPVINVRMDNGKPVAVDPATPDGP